MTPFIYGRSTAHVAEYIAGTPGGWQSICSYRVERTWRDLKWTSDNTRLTPWCFRCVGRVRTLAADVLGDLP
jgi:hypothetical protein